MNKKHLLKKDKELTQVGLNIAKIYEAIYEKEKDKSNKKKKDYKK